MKNSMIVLKLIFFIYLLILLPIFIFHANKHGKAESLQHKMALSILFCVAGLIGTTINDFSIYAVFILFGLIMSLVGDYFLIFIESDMKKFIAGILCFGLTHVFYLASMYSIAAFIFWDLFVTFIFYLLLLFFIGKQKINFGAAKYPLYIYSMIIILMTVKALSMLYYSPYTMQSRLLLAVGAVLFMLSDVFLGIYEYMNKKTLFRNLNNIAYFTGQLLIAASLFFT